MRLTFRGELVVACLITAALLGSMWLAAALGTWITGVQG